MQQIQEVASPVFGAVKAEAQPVSHVRSSAAKLSRSSAWHAEGNKSLADNPVLQ